MPTARSRTGGGSTSGAPAAALRVLAVMLGAFTVLAGIERLGWIADSSLLSRQYEQWLQQATPAARWYVETLGIPGAPIFARLVPVAQLAAGAALIVGFWTRLAAAVALLIALNFDIAAGRLEEWTFLRDAAGLPLLGGLIALTVGGSKLPFSVSR